MLHVHDCMLFLDIKPVRGPQEAIPTLNRLPASRIPPHKSLFFNELKLSDFKSTLQKAGFQAEFNQGLLVVNNNIAVKKVGKGN